MTQTQDRPPDVSSPRTRVAAYALCVDDADRILLCRISPGYPAAGWWTLPGGGIDFGEDPADAVLRELTEETGLTGEIEKLAFVHSGIGQPDPERGAPAWHAIRIVYRVRPSGGELRPELDESTDDAAWVSLDEVRRYRIVDLVDAVLESIEAG